MSLPISTLQRSMSDRPLSIVVVIVFLLLGSSALYLPRYVNFNPDEARILIDVNHWETGGFFAEHPLRVGDHLGSEVQYYLLPKVTTVTVKTLTALAAGFSILTLVYVIWLARAYSLFGTAGLLGLLLIIGTNGAFNYYEQWGVFDYSQRILQSVFLLHMLLFLHKRRLDLSKGVLALVLFGFCVFTIGYAALALPIAVLLVVAFLFRRTSENDDTRDATKAAVRGGLILLISVLVVGLLTLKYATHPEFLHPRPEIRHLFFPLGNYPKTAAGLLVFLGSTTLSFLLMTFYFVVPMTRGSIWSASPGALTWILTFAMALAFIIGLVGSLFGKTRHTARFILGAYVVSVLLSLVGLAVLGIYAFGDIRYALFVDIPLLVLAAYGIMDVLRWTARRLPSWLAHRAQWAGSPVFVGVVLVASAGTTYSTVSRKWHFNATFTKVVQRIEADRSPLLFYDTYAKWNLRVVGIDQFPHKRTFLFSFVRPQPPGQEFQSFVASDEDVLWVTYHLAQGDTLLAPYVAELRKTHFRIDDLSFSPWRVTRWTSWASPHGSVALPFRVDIGDSTARQWMRAGWQRDEGLGGETFAWSDGDRSMLTIPLPPGRDIRMHFGALPFAFPQSPAQRVTVVLNGTVVEGVPLQPGLHRYSVNLPAAALHQLLDTLEFRYAYARVPRNVLPNSADKRELAVAWHSITFAAPAQPDSTSALPGSSEHRADQAMQEKP